MNRLLSLVDDILADHPDEPRPVADDPHGGAASLTTAVPHADHPHRRPLRSRRRRRPGTVRPAPAVCLSPVRSAPRSANTPTGVR